MRDRRVGAVLVTEVDQRLLGIFTGRDAVRDVAGLVGVGILEGGEDKLA